MKIALLLLACAVTQSWAQCNRNNCKDGCSCFTDKNPMGLDPNEIPQFVMITFDDAVSVTNYPMYKNLLNKRFNKGNNCSIHATFFVTHDYTNYHYCHQLYRGGNELAVHSISHVTNTEYWKNMNYTHWNQELVGMRKIMARMANIPESEITGSRAPFLQTSGNPTFRVMKDAGFQYDSSMPTLRHTDPPIWPYSLDHGYKQDCQIEPCPNETFGALYEVPLVNYKNDNGFVCAMTDGCAPYPTTESDTFDYLKKNFLRHYRSNKAPFPLFLHQAWLQHEERENGYMKFCDYMLGFDDVYLVTVQEVVNYLKKPVSLKEYNSRPCQKNHPERCKSPGMTCPYKDVPPSGNRYMTMCAEECPERYPWVGNPEG